MLPYSWLIPALPLLSFALIVFFLIRSNKASSYTSIAAILGSLALSVAVLAEVLGNPQPQEFAINWIFMESFKLPMVMYIDPLTAVMVVMVSLVASLIQIYSLGYMHGDPRFARYYAYMSLFAFSMLGLVVAGSFFTMFIFWELVGLTSYFLIGFWFEKKIASDAGKKAFITTKIGDFGFLIGLLVMFFAAGTLNMAEIFDKVHHHEIALGTITAAGLLMFCGAIGKSAQFPLHVWLPDAMEGPTPVSALIHAATMVAAGVYLTARLMPLVITSHTMAMVVAIIGAFTAFMAASIGLVQNDIKRVLAYSTISQLGYMILALGMGGYTAGTFHLMTHACFKALLFLGAGSVIHAVHTNDIQEMGGLGRKMKTTAATFFIASFSIAGIFPLSGFWSKDEIFAVAWEGGHYILLVVAILAAFMTAFYMFRLCFMVFTGKPRDQEKYDHARESPKNMTIPLVILAFLSITAGWVGIPWLKHGYGSFVFFEHPHHVAPNYILMVISTIVALSGIYLAYLMYYKGSISPVKMAERFKRIYRVLFNKYYFDELYTGAIIEPTYRLTEKLYKFDLGVIDWLVNFFGDFTLFLSWAKERFDTYVVDGAVNGLGYTIRAFGGGLRRIQTGQLQNYAFVIFLGLVVFILLRFL